MCFYEKWRDELDYRQRELATSKNRLQAEALAKLEGLADSLDADSVAERELIKIQHQIVNLQNRFSRLVYLSGEVYSND